MSKSKQATNDVTWAQAPDGSWHPVVQSTGTTTVNVQKSSGCATAIGAVLLLVVLAVVALIVIGAASTTSKKPTSTTTTAVTSTSVVQ